MVDEDADVVEKAVDAVVEKVGKAGEIIMDPGIGIPAYFWDDVLIVAVDDDDRDLSVDTLFDGRKGGSIESGVRE